MDFSNEFENKPTLKYAGKHFKAKEKPRNNLKEFCIHNSWVGHHQKWLIRARDQDQGWHCNKRYDETGCSQESQRDQSKEANEDNKGNWLGILAVWL